MNQPPGVSKSVDLKNFNWWKVGGSAQFYAEPSTVEEIINVVKWAHSEALPITVLGDGSNCLISDQGISGLVLHTHKLSGILSEQTNGDNYELSCWSGTPKLQVMQLFLKRKLSPALFLSGLPGQVGGGVVMNAGVREKREPREFNEIVKSFEVVSLEDGSLKSFEHSQIEWAYRSSKGWQPGVITKVNLSWPNQPDLDVPKMVVAANKSRKSKQPLELPSGGSTFKNPSAEVSAGYLIEKCGLKGFKIGGAQVSEKHANFIVNINNASSQDVWDVIDHVQKTVKRLEGVDLHTEVIRLGEFQIKS
ncbi:MAG: UDP-N-acetylmuramate dehydrogenase [Bdellovibrionales bacterium]